MLHLFSWQGIAVFIEKPYLIFLGDITDSTSAKTGFGLRDWCRDDVLGQFRLPGCDVDLGVPDMDPDAARRAGARSIVIGIAPDGGQLTSAWVEALAGAARAGLDVVSGLHSRLADYPAIAQAAAATGVRLTDVRGRGQYASVASGRPRTGQRLLTVGTDCALGKKYTALLVARALVSRGVAATFRATGQTGIMIAGSGIPIDAIVADFVAGAAEQLSPDADEAHWDVIEGQGSLFHPAYAAVTTGLVHGSQPDAMILCHAPGRNHIDGYPDYPIPALSEAARRYEELARLTNPRARILGVSLNTSGLGDRAARDAIASAAADLRLPCTDPYRFGCDPLVDALLSARVA